MSFFTGILMHAFLLFGEETFPIPPGDLVRVGSAESCDVHLQRDAFISRQHCSVSLLDDQLTIVDLDSSHGTIVNGVDIGNEPNQLKDGDSIVIGRSLLIVSLVDSDTANEDSAGNHLFR